ncbi:unnamed protein product [Lupinus luteus]|uniref:Zinc-finger domain-containing protein n=1 Tax=Lupinus luteus TaxID=3873 RepID=A0AAV1YCS7_LUPLU
MPGTMRKRGRGAKESVSIPNSLVVIENNHENNNISEYELSRQKRIRENRERMGNLGLINLSLKLKAQTQSPPPRRTRFNPKTPPLPPSAPSRRSSRLQNASPVSYCELPQKKGEDENGKNGKIVIEAGAKPEIYTEEHEKLLGNTERNWTLFVDGCGKDGKRIYDSFQGKTCHQCRQKTLGYRTCCSQCNMVQGQFCGDCLYMRYGEHVIEALENPTWLCPVCRGICNCSLCRQAKGWAPTGALYKKVSRLGYKSVAHYLVQTRRSDIDVKNHQGSPKPLAETESDDNEVSAKRSLLFTDVQDQPEKVKCSDTMKPPKLEKVECSDTMKPPKLEKVECSDTMKPLASSSTPSSDNIAGRLRSRVKKTL